MLPQQPLQAAKEHSIVQMPDIKNKKVLDYSEYETAKLV